VLFGVAVLIAHVQKLTLWGLSVVERLGLVVSIRMCAVLCSGINCTCTESNIMGTVSGGEGGLSCVYTYVCCLV
jgi:hypothetical protein